MVITPEFTITQDARFVYFKIRCPNVAAKEMEMTIVDMEFHFFADPYILVLNFRHRLVDNENGTAEYNLDTGFFQAKLEKAIRGEDFPEIALFSTLRPTPPAKPKIELISSPSDYTDEDPDPHNYGYNSWACNFFENLSEIIPYVTDIPDPDHTPLVNRRVLRILDENENFDADRVLNDSLTPQTFDLSELASFHGEFTGDESRRLYAITRIDFLISRAMAKRHFFSIADVVFAGVYDALLFAKEGSCESHWTIAKLSGTLSWFDVPLSATDAVLMSLRRSMVYPLFRSYGFAKVCWEQTSGLFREGRTAVLKCLLRSARLMEKGEHRWRLNRLYFEPMMSWLQHMKQEEYDDYSGELVRAVAEFPDRAAVGEEWCIDLLEQVAEKQRQAAASGSK
jgi:protein SHQ1